MKADLLDKHLKQGLKYARRTKVRCGKSQENDVWINWKYQEAKKKTPNLKKKPKKSLEFKYIVT